MIEHGSFNRAARAMYLSVPSVVQQINLLEKRMEVCLLVRSKHGVTLTPEGVIFAEGARKLVQLCQDTKKKMRLASHEFTCGIGPRHPTHLTSSYWPTVHSKYPDAVLRYCQFDDGNASEETLPVFCEAMASGARYRQFSSSPLIRDSVYIPVLDVDYCLAVPPEHPFALQNAA